MNSQIPTHRRTLQKKLGAIRGRQLERTSDYFATYYLILREQEPQNSTTAGSLTNSEAMSMRHFVRQLQEDLSATASNT
jgi:hypothetical protein